jgi:hypothetical protein
LNDTIINKEIKKLIIEETNSNDPEHLFKRGFGYITVDIRELSNSDTTLCYYISPSFYNIKEGDIDSKYPIFYTYVADRLVLIYFKILEYPTVQPVFSSRSKTKIRKKINHFLEKPTARVFYDSSGNEVFMDKKFRLDRFRFDSGKYIYVMKNGIHKVVDENR